MNPHEKEQIQDNGHNRGKEQPVQEHHQLVTIVINNRSIQLEKGAYLVSRLKSLGGVPQADDLDEVVGGKLKPLADDATVHIHENEVFVSHVKAGGSS